MKKILRTKRGKGKAAESGFTHRFLRDHRALVCLSVFLTFGIPAAFAQEPGNKDGYATLSGRKLLRGLQNVGMGWMEVPAGIQKTGERHGVGAAATWGLLDGMGRAISRTAIGIFEVVTFPVGVPRDFEPLMDSRIGETAPSQKVTEEPDAR